MQDIIDSNNCLLVSICIPTYNGAPFIAEAMDSAIAQTYPNLEIVVSDDASKDETLKIIESYKSRTTIPINIYHHKPSGIGANWNNCIKRAKGIYIKFLFQDDVLLSHCIEKMLAVLVNDKTLALVASKREFIVEDSFLSDDSEKWVKLYGDLQLTLNLSFDDGIGYLDKTLFKSPEFFKSPLNKIGEPTTVLFKKSLVDDIGYFREDLNQVLDYEFCYRVLKNDKTAILEDKLVKFRLHNLQTTVKNKERDVYSTDYIVYERIIFDNYFWYLNTITKKIFLRKFNPWVNNFYNTIDSIRKVMPK